MANGAQNGLQIDHVSGIRIWMWKTRIRGFFDIITLSVFTSTSVKGRIEKRPV